MALAWIGILLIIQSVIPCVHMIVLAIKYGAIYVG